jgi:hypothetical protein
MAIQKNWHLTIQPKFMLFAQRSLIMNPKWKMMCVGKNVVESVKLNSNFECLL